MVVKTVTRKKTNKTMKEELLNSPRENDAVEGPGFNIDNLIDSGEAIAIINDYEEIIKTQNKKTDKTCCKTGHMLKKFRDTEDFIKNEGLSRSSVYFEIGLYKFLTKFPALRKSTLSSHCLNPLVPGVD